MNRKKLTDEKFLNLFKTDKGWIFASRNDKPKDGPDAVVIAAIHRDENDSDVMRIVVTKEWREPLQDYEYGFPAGLIDDGETIEECAKRELKEETGLDITIVDNFLPTTYNSSGMSDESVRIIMAECTGTPSREFLQDNEDIETILVDVNDKDFFLDENKKFSTNLPLMVMVIRLTLNKGMEYVS